MFAEDMAGTHEVLYIAKKLIAQLLPKISKQLEIETIQHVSMISAMVDDCLRKHIPLRIGRGVEGGIPINAVTIGPCIQGPY